MTALAHPLSDSERRRAFRVARRHAARVRVLRIALPALAAIIMAGLLFSALRPQTVQIGPVAFDGLELRDGALVMDNPRLSGVDRNARAYTLNAATASQRIDTPALIDLRAIDARMAIDAETTARVLADQGEFNQEAETLRLFNGVNMTASNGYEVRMHDAFVDLKAGSISSDEPVAVDMLNGTLRANAVRITERGAVIAFVNGVDLTLYLRPQSDDAAATAQD